MPQDILLIMYIYRAQKQVVEKGKTNLNDQEVEYSELVMQLLLWCHPRASKNENEKHCIDLWYLPKQGSQSKADGNWQTIIKWSKASQMLAFKTQSKGGAILLLQLVAHYVHLFIDKIV